MAPAMMARVFFGNGRMHIVTDLNTVQYGWVYIGDMEIINGQLVVSRSVGPWPLSEDQLDYAQKTTPVEEPRAFGRAVLRNGGIEVLYGPVGPVVPSDLYLGKAALNRDRVVIIVDTLPLPNDRLEDGDYLPREWTPRGSVTGRPIQTPETDIQPEPKRKCVASGPAQLAPVSQTTRIIAATQEVAGCNEMIEELEGLLSDSDPRQPHLRQEIYKLATALSCEDVTLRYKGTRCVWIETLVNEYPILSTEFPQIMAPYPMFEKTLVCQRFYDNRRAIAVSFERYKNYDTIVKLRAGLLKRTK